MKRVTGLLAVAVGAIVLLSAVTSLGAAEIESSIVRGAKLYDEWYKVIDVEAPTVSHAAYPKDKKYAEKPDANWRCKECHGWDYMGKDGGYSSGKHASGIKGINGAKNKPVTDIVALLKSDTHGYADKLNEQDMLDVALFVSKGQVDMDMYIDRSSKMAKGDNARGEVYFNTICMNCHGMDGKLPKEMDPLGKLMGNPWEIMHKVLNGHPGENMPALRALDRQVVADIMSHMATLPKK